MKVLFDQNVPRALGQYLPAHEITRSAEKGWEEFKNGDLLLAAEENGFDLLLTCDRNLEYQQKVRARKIAILALSTNNWPLILERVHEIAAPVDYAKPGAYLPVDCGAFRRRRRPPTRA